MPDPDLPGRLSTAGSLDVSALLDTPAWLPLKVSPERAVHLIRLSESDYRAASMLDARLLPARPQQGRCSVDVLATAAEHLAPSAQFIFHIGHVGSTLLARLLGEHPSLFCLREPMLLRAAVDGDTANGGLQLEACLGVLSRTWQTQQRALIKTTSFVNEISARLLACSDTSRAILLYTSAPTYLRAILAGANSRLETRALAPLRLQRLQRRTGRPVPVPRHEGEWVAMSWLCEMTTLAQTAADRGTRVRWMDFERFLLDPAAGLAEAAGAVGAQPDRHWIEHVLAGPLMRQYSKAPEHAYDPELRRAVLAQAGREHAAQIRAGLQWLEQLGTAHPFIASALTP